MRKVTLEASKAAERHFHRIELFAVDQLNGDQINTVLLDEMHRVRPWRRSLQKIMILRNYDPALIGEKERLATLLESEGWEINIYVD